MSFYDKVENYVIDTFTKAGNPKGVLHFKRTVYWMQRLQTDADEALRIAAIAHDIGRASLDNAAEAKGHEIGFDDPAYFQPHEVKGAEIISKYLFDHGASKEMVARVKSLISHHEEGGNDDQNLLKDADSISFFENSAMKYVTDKMRTSGATKVKKKLDWMYNRMSSERAKGFAKPFYTEALKAVKN